MAKTFYDIFEVDPGATADEIRTAYKRMVQRHHPDKNRGHASSEELLKAINYAYSILSDARKRASYDAKLASSANGGDGGATPNGTDSAYVYTGEASASTARGAASEAFAARPFETRSSGWSQISHINSWLAFGMLVLLFFAVSRFFYQQVATHGVLSTAEPGSATLFYGIMIGVITAGGAVWVVGKMVAYTLPLAWPMNLFFRAKIRADLDLEHSRIASVVLIMGILLTFAVPNLSKQGTLAVPPTATAPVFEGAREAPVAAQSPRKNATILPAPEPASPVILAQNAPSTTPADAVKLHDIPAPAPLPPVVKKPNAIIAEPLPSPVKAAAPPVSRAVVDAKTHNAPAPVPSTRQALTPSVQARNIAPAPIVAVVPPPTPAPVAKAHVKPIQQEKPIAKKTPPVAALPTKVAVTAPAVLPPPPIEKKTVLSAPPTRAPALALVTPEPTAEHVKAAPAKSAPEKKETPALAEEGDPALANHRKKAQQGAADAQYQLGRAYEKGDGVARDYQQAGAWYRKAADLGYGPAQHSLGSMYMLGKGMAMDPVSAYVWLSLAANNNVSSGQQAIDYLVDTLTPNQLADAKRKLAKWSPPRKR